MRRKIRRFSISSRASSKITAGKCRLAYEIKDLRDGFYVVSRVKATPAIIAELDRILKITEEVLRHMIVKEDE